MDSNFRVGPWLVQPSLNTISLDGTKVPLEPKVMEVLVSLAEQPGETLAKEKLIQAVWADAFVTDDVLKRCIFQLRQAFEDDAHQPRIIETIPKRGYRLIAPVSRDGVGAVAAQAASESASISPQNRKLRLAVTVGALAIFVAGGLLWRWRQPRHLTERDTVVLADFDNKTGDPAFDGTLRQGLAVQLDQSPFLNVLSDQEVQDTLKLMGRSPVERLTPELARDLCKRAGSKAYLGGMIAGLGSQYVVIIKLVNCQTGDFLAQEQAIASGKEQVLKALDGAARELRGRAGESLSSVQKFDVPLEQASTPSLEALKAYSLGMKIRTEQGYAEAIPFFKRAIERDPNFASAYASLGSCYGNNGEVEAGREYIHKAFELRNRASEREKFRISNIYRFDTGELQKALEVAKLWAQEYPRDKLAHLDSGFVLSAIGQHESAVTEYLAEVRLDPDSAETYAALMAAYAALNRLGEAKISYQQALTRNINLADAHIERYEVAFLEGNESDMASQMAWAVNKPYAEAYLLAEAGSTQWYSGRLTKGRELRARAIESAQRNNKRETAAKYQVRNALGEADYGNYARAREGTKAALAAASSREVQIAAALVLARAGDPAHAQSLANDLAKRFPVDTLLQGYWLPIVRAAIEMNRSNPARAVELLQATAVLELNPDGRLYADYLRGEAYLRLHKGDEAVAEFQKLLDHRGIVLNEHIGPLAHLQLGRSYALRGDTAKARAAYNDFLTLWKDADPDIPILIAAKAEYAKLVRQS